MAKRRIVRDHVNRGEDRAGRTTGCLVRLELAVSRFASFYVQLPNRTP